MKPCACRPSVVSLRTAAGAVAGSDEGVVPAVVGMCLASRSVGLVGDCLVRLQWVAGRSEIR